MSRMMEDDDYDEVTPSNKKRVKTTKADAKKKAPNLLISGTPGTGKTSLCKKIAEKCQGRIEVINIGEFAKENGFLGDFDEDYQCPELDEDRVVDHLETRMSDPASVTTMVIDHHGTEFFPERWFDAVFVLRTDNTILYDRLNSRGYTGKKLEDNMQCEIFQTILDEARESYREEIVHELSSQTESDLESNADRIVSWINQWKVDNN